ncbi:MAG TPA: penicillin-binding transpeptidase domain-containing protein, partial [Pseudomonas sp.]|nr:penicillin-binding transpeptidase domain-containing protein [Pseudomonas sp.]
QMAMIAGLPKAPSRFNPLINPQRSKERRDWILGRMLKLGAIDQARYEAAMAEPIDAHHHVQPPELNAPYVAEMARAELVGLYGSGAYTDGYRVTTTVPSQLQESANQALHQGLIDYDQRHGYRGPETRLPGLTREAWLQELTKHKTLGGLEPVIVSQVEKSGILVLNRDGQEEPVAWDSMKWARPFLNTNSLGPRPLQPADVVQIGDLVRVEREKENNTLLFRQFPGAQAALVSLDPQSGAIRALVGGFSFEQSNYNRAAQAKRQPGSSFKPFIYSAALDRGYTAASLVNDAPIVFQEAGMEEAWRPKNDNNTFLGPIRMREALYKSRNLVSIRLLQSIGINYALDYVSQFGFKREELPRNLSLALGTANLTPLEIAGGWATFANGGYKVQPYLVERIYDRDGKPVFIANPPRTQASADQANQQNDALQAETPNASVIQPVIAPQIIDERTAYIMTSMLQDVIKRGTGRRALAMGRGDLAGKTGTTNESKDSWFSGYNADYITTVWTGFDQPESLGRHEYGGTVALPIWMSYMSAALKDKPEHMPPEPAGLLTLRIDPVSGRAASPGAPNAYFELFKSEDSPPPMSELDPSLGIPGSPLPADEAAPIDLF